MCQKDLWQSDYFDSNVRFADAYNGIFFDGQAIIKPEELEPCDTVFIQHFQNQKFIPIIPLILYLGKDTEWDGATTLHDLLDIDEELKPFVSNYKLNLYDYHNETDFSKFKTENRLLFEILANRGNKKKVNQIFKDECEKYDLDSESATALLEMADLKIDLKKLEIVKDGKVKYKMCKAIEEIKEDARDEGYKAGMETNMYASVKSLMKNLNLTLEQALDALEITGENREKFYS